MLKIGSTIRFETFFPLRPWSSVLRLRKYAPRAVFTVFVGEEKSRPV